MESKLAGLTLDPNDNLHVQIQDEGDRSREKELCCGLFVSILKCFIGYRGSRRQSEATRRLMNSRIPGNASSGSVS